MTKEVDNWRQEATEGEISASARLARPWLEKVRQDMGSTSGVGTWSGLGVQERVRWEMGSSYWRRDFGVGTTLG